MYQEPFTHGIISDVVTDLDFLKELETEMKSKLKYLKKNNDLYKFHQTGDLANTKLKSIRKFRDQILYGSVLKTLEKITNINLSSNIDVTSSKYEFSDYLLCHDDDIHDDKNKKGRRIAFIYYLVPEDWSSKDGGNLDLFNVNGKNLFILSVFYYFFILFELNLKKKNIYNPWKYANLFNQNLILYSFSKYQIVHFIK